MDSKLKIVTVSNGAEHIATHHCDTNDEAQTWFNREYPDGHTVVVEDNPDIAYRAQLKAKWQAVTDPAAKALLKILLKDMLDDDE